MLSDIEIAQQCKKENIKDYEKLSEKEQLEINEKYSNKRQNS